MDELKSGTESVAANKEVPKGSEEVLIEIDGKFELVSAADMQANHPDLSCIKHSEANNTQDQAAIKKVQDDLPRKMSKEDQSDVENYDEDFEHDSCASSAPSSIDKSPSKEQNKPHVSKQAKSCNPADSELFDPPELNEKTAEKHRDSSSDTAAAKYVKYSAVEDSQSGIKRQHSSAEIVVSEHESHTVQSESTKSRTKSAPESRSTQFWEEDEADRRVMCERAFKAWLAKKDAQISEERRLQRANTKVPTTEEKLEKIEMCENAYKAWLENKNRQVRERRYLQRTIKSASTDNKEQESASAFRNWLQQKQIQRQKEKAVEIRRVKEEAELAQKVDPSIANQAYRRWLRKKNLEAREEAARRLELQRYYFRQGRLLKESLRNRFQGF